MYNEEILISKTLKYVLNYFEYKAYDYEIIVVDDKSTDNSVSFVKKLNHPKIKLICKEKNEGKGSAIKEGMKHVSKDYVGFMDADLPYDLTDIGNMIEKLKIYDLAIGSRAIEGSKVEAHPNWYRILLSKVFCNIRNILFKLDIKDTQSGIKFFKKEAANKIFDKQLVKGFGFDTEILSLAKKYNYKIKEVPVSLLKEHSFKKSKLNPIRDSLKIFFDLLFIKFNDFKGKYQ